MLNSPSIDEVIDDALDLLESEKYPNDKLITWITDNLICTLDTYQDPNNWTSRCDVSGYEVVRVGPQIIILAPKTEVLDSWEARRLAVALLRAAENADQAEI